MGGQITPAEKHPIGVTVFVSSTGNDLAAAASYGVSMIRDWQTGVVV
ncbi:hypothetical protein [Burkholderia thailandensis]|nr:hypothetical protein [Burkholderia thailandensis]MDW9239806.1 hypothetical protein [Burkholderia thailandensis]